MNNIEIGEVREEEAAEAGEVIRLNFSEPLKDVYPKYVFSLQGLAVSIIIYSLLIYLLQPSSVLYHVTLFALAFGLHVTYLSAWFYFDPKLQHPDTSHVWSYWGRSDCCLLVARDLSKRGRIVGAVAVQRLASDEAVCELSRLRVIKGYEGQGIAHRLNEELERRVRETFRCKKIVLLTHPDLFVNAPGFYERRGYRLVRKKTAGEYYPGLYWNESYYEKEL